MYSVDCNITIGVGIISINYPQYIQETIKKMNGSDNSWVSWVRWDNNFNIMSGTQTQIFYNSATAVVFWEHFNKFLHYLTEHNDDFKNKILGLWQLFKKMVL